ncbi:MAG: GldG family protein [bacterium]
MSETPPHSDLRAIFQNEASPSLESVVNETRTRMAKDQPAGKAPPKAPTNELARERAELADRLRTGKAGTGDNKPLFDLAGTVGFGCLLLGFASMAFTTGVHPASLVLLGLGVILCAVWVFSDLERVQRIVSSRGAIYSTNLGFTIVMLAAILVVTNMLANRYFTTFDLTTNKINSLSPQSIELLGKLKESGREITITAFYPKDAVHRDAIHALETVFGRYTHLNDKVKFNIVDPDINAKLAADKGITVPGTILFEGGANTARINSMTEPAITGALLKVTNPESKIVYFVAGHNELGLTNDSDDGLTKLAEQLEHENLVVKELSIPKENGIPADAAAVIVARPTDVPLQTREIDALTDYVDRGGNVMVTLDPHQAPEVTGWLKGYGVTAREDRVIDPEDNEFDEPTIPILLPVEGNHPLLPDRVMSSSGVEGLDPGVVAPSARSLDLAANSRLDWTPLYATGSLLSFGETDPNAATPAFTEGTDPQGPLTIIAAGQPKATESDDPAAADTAPTGGRLLVAGDAHWMSNGQISKAHNRDLAVNAVDWLVGSEGQIAIRPKMPNMERASIKGNSINLVLGTIFGIPILVAGAGVAVWWKRRSW